jgi:hypothetical protein
MKPWFATFFVILLATACMSTCTPGPGSAPRKSREVSTTPPGEVPESTGTGGSWLLVPQMLGRPEDSTVTLNVVPRVDADLCIAYSSNPGARASPESTAFLPGAAARVPVDIALGGLEPDTRYYYRLLCRRPGADEFEFAHGGSFHTMRQRGATFLFTIQADSHMNETIGVEDSRRSWLYKTTLGNVLADEPDFHLDMGDFAGIEWYIGGGARSLEKALERYLLQRSLLGSISHSVPFYLVIGNHEGEQGWRREREADSLEVFGTLARKALIPNPYPDEFYTGNAEETECCGLRESYYAWEWGDALFVVLDPFWNTMSMPQQRGGY